MMGESKRDEIIHVRCEEDLKEKVDLAATAEGMSTSAYVRRELLNSSEETLSSAGVSLAE